jgi:hypothetical protein
MLNEGQARCRPTATVGTNTETDSLGSLRVLRMVGSVLIQLAHRPWSELVPASVFKYRSTLEMVSSATCGVIGCFWGWGYGGYGRLGEGAAIVAATNAGWQRRGAGRESYGRDTHGEKPQENGLPVVAAMAGPGRGLFHPMQTTCCCPSQHQTSARHDPLSPSRPPSPRPLPPLGHTHPVHRVDARRRLPRIADGQEVSLDEVG